jgi:hypothetical protein
MCVGHWDKEIAGQARPVENYLLDDRKARLDRASRVSCLFSTSLQLSYFVVIRFQTNRKKKKETRRLRDTCIISPGNSCVISTYVFLSLPAMIVRARWDTGLGHLSAKHSLASKFRLTSICALIILSFGTNDE